MLVNKINKTNIKKEFQIIPFKRMEVKNSLNTEFCIKVETDKEHGLQLNDYIFLKRTVDGYVHSTNFIKLDDRNLGKKFFSFNYQICTPIKIYGKYDGSGYLYVNINEQNDEFVGLKTDILVDKVVDGEHVPYVIENAELIDRYNIKIKSQKRSIYDDLSECDAYMIDQTFFDYNKNEVKPDVEIYKGSLVINLNVPVSNDISTDLNREENISMIYENEKKKIIPDIIDYEKKMFSPYYFNGAEYKRAEKIIINLYFRDREGSKDWTTDDTKGWFQKKVIGFTPAKESVKEGDLMGYLGFVDDDVYYQKLKLSKSFIRLSYYDDNRPNKQMLLNYSTVFCDTNKMYSNIVKWAELKLKWSNNEDTKNRQIILEMDKNKSEFGNLGPDERISSRFIINDIYNKESSSEGFYIYLYDSVLDGEKDENGFNDIYMKVEFNHAKYGRTVPFILPHIGKDPIHIYDDNFPTSFMKKNENGEYELNMNSYYDFLNINIKVKYDENLNDYIYVFPYSDFDAFTNTITLNIVEPRINDIF